MVARRATSFPSYAHRRSAAALLLFVAACVTGQGGGGSDDGFMTLGGSTTAHTQGSDSGSGDETETGGSACGLSMTECDGECVDVDNDPQNCGGCGITCVIPNGEAVCDEGICGLASCLDGWGDCDGNIVNGCEAESLCEAGMTCQTECGSLGVIGCPNGCDAVCETQAEVCNAMDDDCNGSCDEGADASCRVAVHRAYNGTGGHLYTTDLQEAQAHGLEVEGFYHLYSDEAPDLVEFFRCLKPSGKHLSTTAQDCEGLGQLVGTLGYIGPDERCGATPLYRVYNSGVDGHFYTTSASERDNAVANLGFADQGIAGYVWPAL